MKFGVTCRKHNSGEVPQVQMQYIIWHTELYIWFIDVCTELMIDAANIYRRQFVSFLSKTFLRLSGRKICPVHCRLQADVFIPLETPYSFT